MLSWIHIDASTSTSTGFSARVTKGCTILVNSVALRYMRHNNDVVFDVKTCGARFCCFHGKKQDLTKAARSSRLLVLVQNLEPVHGFPDS